MRLAPREKETIGMAERGMKEAQWNVKDMDVKSTVIQIFKDVIVILQSGMPYDGQIHNKTARLFNAVDKKNANTPCVKKLIIDMRDNIINPLLNPESGK